MEIIAELYGYTLDYILYRMSFAQAISLIDVHNERERKAREAAEEKAHTDDPTYVDPDKYKVDPSRPETLPSLDDVQAAFGKLFG